MKIRILLNAILVLTGSTFCTAQSLETYIKSQNSLLPVSPEASQLMKYIDYPVNHFTGNANVDAPLYTIKGKGLHVPVSLSYNAGGGVKVDELASEVGLGWSLGPGEITREVRGGPDEGGSGVSGIFNNVNNTSYYHALSINSPLDPVFESASKGQMDLEPDLFYFRFGNYSGKFVYDDNLDKFECTVQQPLVIDFNGTSSGSVFTITTGEGNIYTFAAYVKTSSRSECVGVPMSGSLSYPVVTSWKVSKIVNADRTDSIMFEYAQGNYQFYSSGSSTKYQLLQYSQSMPSVPRPDINCYTYNEISGWLYLNKVYSSQDSMIVGHSLPREDIAPGAYAISDIKLYDKSGNLSNNFVFEYDYYQRNWFVGYTPEKAYNKKSLRLLSVKDFGNSTANANPLKWTFKYEPGDLPGRLSYAQDFWGYPNYNSYAQSLAPSMYLTTIYPPALLDGANRSPDPSRMSVGLLNEIIFPTGGSTKFKYEPNTTAVPPPQASAETVNRHYVINAFAPANGYFNTNESSYDVTFVVNEGPDPAINFNNPQGGVIANIHVSPSFAPAAPSTQIFPAKLHFQLDGPSGGLYQKSRNNVWLANGTYTLKVKSIGFMNQDQPAEGVHFDQIRNFNFTVTYKDTDPGTHNYYCGGVRVKSVVTTDQYAGNTMIKEYQYHDPETDSSYGRYIAPSRSTYQDYVHSVNSSSDFSISTYLVRMGNCVMPGSNIAGSSVVYPKVLEHVREGAKKYTTAYHYNIFAPGNDNTLPFTPPMDLEAKRGKISLKTSFQDQGNTTFAKVAEQSFTYDESPASLTSNQDFLKVIIGIKCAPYGYSENPTPFNSLMFPAVIKAYVTVTSRAYLASDTTTAYFGSTTSSKKWNSYKYGDYNQLPIEVKSGNSDGSISTQENWFAVDHAVPTTEISNELKNKLSASNRVTVPLITRSYKDNQLLSQQYTHARFSGDKLLVDSMRQALLSASPATELWIKDYDSYANPLTVQLKGNRFRKYIWETKRGLPLATCTLPSNSNFYFTSFEHTSESGWNTQSRNSNLYFTGNYSYNLNGSSLLFAGFTPSSKIEVYAWKTGGTLYANNVAATATGKVSGQWAQFKVVLPPGTTAVNISGSAVIDQLAIVPSGSNFEANVYDAAGRVISRTDNNMQTSFFEYDNFGRLSTVRDEQYNILKKNAYQYQVPQ